MLNNNNAPQTAVTDAQYKELKERVRNLEETVYNGQVSNAVCFDGCDSNAWRNYINEHGGGGSFSCDIDTDTFCIHNGSTNNYFKFSCGNKFEYNACCDENTTNVKIEPTWFYVRTKGIENHVTNEVDTSSSFINYSNIGSQSGINAVCRMVTSATSLSASDINCRCKGNACLYSQSDYEEAGIVSCVYDNSCCSYGDTYSYVKVYACCNDWYFAKFRGEPSLCSRWNLRLAADGMTSGYGTIHLSYNGNNIIACSRQNKVTNYICANGSPYGENCSMATNNYIVSGGNTWTFCCDGNLYKNGVCVL